MEKSLKKQRETLAVLLYILLISGLVYAVVRPLLSKITSIKDKIQEEQIKQESSKKHLEELPKIKEEYQMIKDVDLKQYLLDRGNEVALIEKLEALATKSGNKISIAVQDQDKKATTTKAKKGQEKSITTDLPSDNYLQLQITLNGDFNSIGRFVKSLETLDSYSDIIGMEIRNKEGAETAATSASPFSNDKPSEDKNLENGVEAVLNTVFYAR